MAWEDEGERIQSHRVAGAPQVEHGAIGLGDPREESEADVTAPQVGLEAPLLGGPPATERPDVGGVGIVAAAMAQPCERAVEHARLLLAPVWCRLSRAALPHVGSPPPSRRSRERVP